TSLPPQVISASLTPAEQQTIQQNQTVGIVATVQGSSNNAVTWSLSGSGFLSNQSAASVTSELLTRPPWETAQNQMNGEADNAVSFCIVAVSSGLSCTSRRKVLTELASHPHWAWVFAYQGADQNLSAF